MCGIFAYLGNKESFDIIINGLEILLNRGYDSAGISTICNGTIFTSKFASIENNDCIQSLRNCHNKHTNSFIGIGHTRWATHGGKSDINSHPHHDYQNKFSLVHNGIIENYLELKEMLKNNGVEFISQTDSEVIANLISFLSLSETSIFNAICKAQKMMSGTWGVVLIMADDPNRMFCFRNGSPLCLGLDNDKRNVFISSESRSFLKYCNRYILLENNEIVSLEKSENKIYKYDFENEKYLHLNLNLFEKLKSNKFSQNCEPFKHWTIKEIYEQASSIEAAFNYGGRLLGQTSKLGGLDESNFDFNIINHLNIIGCGSSLNSGEIGKYYFKYLKCFETVSCIDSSELLDHDFNYKSKNMLIVISQSGETIDTIIAINKFKNLCNYIFSIVNVVGSSISELSNSGAYLNSGIEMGVASTKSFTSQCLVLLLTAIWISHYKNIIVDHSHTINNIRNLSGNISKILVKYDDISSLGDTINNCSKLFILSGGISRAVADEASLKIKEISYINCHAYQVSSLKHGPFALIDKDTVIIYIASYLDCEIYRKTIISMSETKTRGSFNIFITDNKLQVKDQSIDNLIIIPSTCLLTFPILSIIPLQILAYKLSIIKNINPDFPRNLAKSVTVE
jgi:glucosamine--fructose-6-phosphate aminotransferase (isomerizing)